MLGYVDIRSGEFVRYDAKKANCKKGKICGDVCIPKKSKCADESSTQKTGLSSVVNNSTGSRTNQLKTAAITAGILGLTGGVALIGVAAFGGGSRDADGTQNQSADNRGNEDRNSGNGSVNKEASQKQARDKSIKDFESIPEKLNKVLENNTKRDSNELKEATKEYDDKHFGKRYRKKAIEDVFKIKDELESSLEEAVTAKDRFKESQKDKDFEDFAKKHWDVQTKASAYDSARNFYYQNKERWQRAETGARDAGGDYRSKAPTSSDWDILGVKDTSSSDEVKKAYRKAASQWHPDKFYNASPEQKAEALKKMQEINAAKDRIEESIFSRNPKRKDSLDWINTKIRMNSMLGYIDVETGEFVSRFDAEACGSCDSGECNCKDCKKKRKQEQMKSDSISWINHSGQRVVIKLDADRCKPPNKPCGGNCIAPNKKCGVGEKIKQRAGVIVGSRIGGTILGSKLGGAVAGRAAALGTHLAGGKGMDVVVGYQAGKIAGSVLGGAAGYSHGAKKRKQRNALKEKADSSDKDEYARGYMAASGIQLKEDQGYDYVMGLLDGAG